MVRAHSRSSSFYIVRFRQQLGRRWPLLGPTTGVQHQIGLPGSPSQQYIR